MIRRSRAQSSSLFLMELILAILFFSITSAVCVQFFVKSHLLSQESKVLSQAVNECSNIAEAYDTSESIGDALSLLKNRYPDISAEPAASGQDTAAAVIYYDDTFSPCGEDNAVYALKADFTQDDSMMTAHIEMTDDDSVIYELNTKHHIARRTDYEER